MEKIYLVEPVQDDKDAMLDFMQKWNKFGGRVNPGLLRQLNGDYEEWLRYLASRKAGTKDEVPQTLYLMKSEQNIIIGAVGIRPVLDSDDLLYGGHVAYGVCPELRGRGYGNIALSLALSKLNDMGIEKVLVTCDYDNIPSQKVILHHQGVLDNQIPNEDGILVNRYWIDYRKHKLKVLSNIAHVLNERQIVWTVGASILLCLKGKADFFHDIDLMVSEKDVELLKEVLMPMGELAPLNPNKQYKTRYFLEFTIDGVEVDVMAGFVIVKDGCDYDCSLMQNQVAEYTEINGEQIPFQSLADWRRYYELMGRTTNVEMIDR